MSEHELNRDPYIKSLFEEAGAEVPSDRFTSSIIDTIKAQSSANPYAYKPVISRGAWLIMAFIGIAAFFYLLFVNPSGEKGLEVFGYGLSLDFSTAKGFLSKMAFSFELTPIFKTSIIALFIFTFSNLLIFELKNRSIFK
jgi:hypothetical protein